MPHSIDTPLPPPGSPGSTSDAPSTGDLAKDEAGNIGRTAAAAGSQVASTATDQAREVAAETQRQAQDLLEQGRTQLREQAATQQQKAADGLGSLARELRGMADGPGDAADGPAHQLLREASGRLEELGAWLQDREPADLLGEVRAYARRKPGTFLLGAAVAGVLAGRLTRGITAAHEESGRRGRTRDTGAPASAPLAGAAYGEVDYAGDNYVDPAPSWSGGVEPHPGYGTTRGTGTPLPPPPYGTVPPAGSVVPPSAPAGWDDPTRSPEEGIDR